MLALGRGLEVGVELEQPLLRVVGEPLDHALHRVVVAAPRAAGVTPVDERLLVLRAAVVGAVATIGLALIAVGQMRATRHTAEETRRSSIQPLVYAHAITRDAGDEFGIVAFPDYLRNHGLGPAPALNVSHGVILVGDRGTRRCAFGDERELQFRTLDVGEWIPPLDDPGDSIPNRTIDSVGLPEGGTRGTRRPGRSGSIGRGTRVCSATNGRRATPTIPPSRLGSSGFGRCGSRRILWRWSRLPLLGQAKT